ncbi:IS1595 family transposase [Methylotenera sp. L2L1]|uniref:IS1595 family transposase n=1 Tax=Methylotenera sp. L2L1 TaxID=1502770 RepID=UPI0009DCC4EA|nr:IS1595 family transposase [Methylotenera sp. L2L1]
MAMHYSRNKANRKLTLYQLARLTEEECWEIFRVRRFGEEEKFACPECGAVEKHWFINTRKQWHCKHCNHRFSVTSGTVFHNRKLSLSKLLCILFSFVTGLQGANANELPSDLGVTYKTAFLNINKIREVVFETMDLSPLEGTVHIDCMHICGKPRRSNNRKSSDSFLVNNKLRVRKDSIVPDKKAHPESSNLKKLENRRIILALSQIASNGNQSYGSNRTITYVLKKEKAEIILPLIKKSVAKGSEIMTDFGGAFSKIEPLLGIKHSAVNHSAQYQNDFGINNNQAESFFSRIRRAEFGTFNAMSKTYLSFYASEAGFRNDSKTLGIEDKFYSLLSKILNKEPSKAFCGYNQGKRLGFEYCYS